MFAWTGSIWSLLAQCEKDRGYVGYAREPTKGAKMESRD